MPLLSCLAWSCQLDTAPLRGAKEANVVTLVDASTQPAQLDAARTDMDVDAGEPDQEDAQRPGAECATAADCPASSAECRAAVCRAGRCDEVRKALGTACGMGGVCTAQGVCGECKVGVTAGTPVHHDLHLTPAQRDAGDVLMACVSRCAGPDLELDL